MMRICIGLPVWGRSTQKPGIDAMVGVCTEEGADGIWVGDHVALGAFERSPYPYSGGEFFLQDDDPWYEAFVTLGYIAARSGDLELGTGVALPTLRPPALLAKQVATLTHLGTGGFVLGVGAGWLRTEFEASGVPFEGRGRRLEHCMDVVREYWTGSPQPGIYGDYVVPDGVASHPVPRSPVPILVGGNSDIALARAARIGDGWLGALHRWEPDTSDLASQVAGFRSAWATHRGDSIAPDVGIVQAVPESLTRSPDFKDRVVKKLMDFHRLGLSRVILNIGWENLDHARKVLRTVQGARDDVSNPT